MARRCCWCCCCLVGVNKRLSTAPKNLEAAHHNTVCMTPSCPKAASHCILLPTSFHSAATPPPQQPPRHLHTPTTTNGTNRSRCSYLPTLITRFLCAISALSTAPASTWCPARRSTADAASALLPKRAKPCGAPVPQLSWQAS